MGATSDMWWLYERYSIWCESMDMGILWDDIFLDEADAYNNPGEVDKPV